MSQADPTIQELQEADPVWEAMKDLEPAQLLAELQRLMAAPPRDEPIDVDNLTDDQVMSLSALLARDLAAYYGRPVVQLRRSEVVSFIKARVARS